MYDIEVMKKYIEYLKKDEHYDKKKGDYNDYFKKNSTDEEYAIFTLSYFCTKIGKTKIDNTKRISLISEVAEILNAKPGDEIEYSLSENGIIVKKITVPYKGYDIEQDIINEKLIDYRLKKKMEEINNVKNKDVKKEDYNKIREEYEKMRNE